MPNTVFLECILSHMFLQTNRELVYEEWMSLKAMDLPTEREYVIYLYKYVKFL